LASVGTSSPEKGTPPFSPLSLHFCCILECRVNFFRSQRWVIFDDILHAFTFSNQRNNQIDRDSCSLNARFPMQNIRIRRNSLRYFCPFYFPSPGRLVDRMELLPFPYSVKSADQTPLHRVQDNLCLMVNFGILQNSPGEFAPKR